MPFKQSKIAAAFSVDQAKDSVLTNPLFDPFRQIFSDNKALFKFIYHEKCRYPSTIPTDRVIYDPVTQNLNGGYFSSPHAEVDDYHPSCFLPFLVKGIWLPLKEGRFYTGLNNVADCPLVKMQEDGSELILFLIHPKSEVLYQDLLAAHADSIVTVSALSLSSYRTLLIAMPNASGSFEAMMVKLSVDQEINGVSRVLTERECRLSVANSIILSKKLTELAQDSVIAIPPLQIFEDPLAYVPVGCESGMLYRRLPEFLSADNAQGLYAIPFLALSGVKNRELMQELVTANGGTVTRFFKDHVFPLFVRSFIELLCHHRASLQVHGQNLLLVLDRDNRITGLLYRDMGGVNQLFTRQELESLPENLRDPALYYAENHIQDAAMVLEDHFLSLLYPLTKQVVKCPEFAEQDSELALWLSMCKERGYLKNWTKESLDDDEHETKLLATEFFRYGYLENLFYDSLMDYLRKNKMASESDLQDMQQHFTSPEIYHDGSIVAPCTLQPFFQSFIRYMLKSDAKQRDKMPENLQREFFLARCLSLHSEVHDFSARLYQLLAHEIAWVDAMVVYEKKRNPDKTIDDIYATINTSSLVEHIKAVTKGGYFLPAIDVEVILSSDHPLREEGLLPFAKELFGKFIFRAFADTTDRSDAGAHRSHLLAYQRHGSVGYRNIAYFENLPKSSPLRFDIRFTAMANAICQYNDGLLKRGRDHYPSFVEEQHTKYRVPVLEPPREALSDRRMTAEEQLAFMMTAPAGMRDGVRSGENRYRLLEHSYKSSHEHVGIPVLTGVSGLGVVLFRLFSRFFASLADLKLLQQTIVAYLVANHDHSFHEAVDAINFVLEEPKFREYFLEKHQLDVQQLKLPLLWRQNYNDTIADIFGPVLNENNTVIQESIRGVFSRGEPPEWMKKLIDKTVLRTQQAGYVVGDQVAYFLQDFLTIPPVLLRSLLLEEEFRETDKNSFVTPLEIMVEIYLIGYFSHTPRKFLTDPKSSNIALIQAEGLAHTAAGPAVDEYALREMNGRPAYGFVTLIPETKGAGNLLSDRYYTPLMHMVWVFAGIQANHAFCVAEQGNLANGFDWLTMARQLLQCYGYESASEIKQFCGLSYTDFSCREAQAANFSSFFKRVVEPSGVLEKSDCRQAQSSLL